MNFSIITPCLNASAHIEETVASVSAQSAVRSGMVGLEHIVCDGGSTDGTLEILRRLEGKQTQGPQLRVLSGTDRGMYDALVRGLRLATGDVVAYLNAGDYFHPHAFRVVRDVLNQLPDCQWLTGFAVDYAESGAAVRVALPYRFRRRLHRCGAYGRLLPFVQQESTFWRRDLLQAVDLDRLAGLRLAGDYYLWRCFAERADLHVVAAQLGGFRHLAGQLSENVQGYMAEMAALADAPGPLDRALALMDWLMWHMPPSVKKRLNPRTLHLYDLAAGRWD